MIISEENFFKYFRHERSYNLTSIAINNAFNNTRNIHFYSIAITELCYSKQYLSILPIFNILFIRNITAKNKRTYYAISYV